MQYAEVNSAHIEPCTRFLTITCTTIYCGRAPGCLPDALALVMVGCYTVIGMVCSPLQYCQGEVDAPARSSIRLHLC